MANISDILLLTYLATGESASGSFANWGESANDNWESIEDALGEVSSISVTTADVTLTDAEERALLIKASGALTGNRSIETNDRKGFWFVRNDCTGDFTLTFKTASGTGIVVPQGGACVLVSDGTNVLEMTRNRGVYSLSGMILVPANQSYTILKNAPFPGEINSITTDCDSGTCTLTGKINTTALGGTANSVSTTEEEQAHTSSNDFVAGDDLVLTISSNAACLNLTYTVKYTRTLS